MWPVFAIGAGILLFALFRPKRSSVTEVVNLRTGLREVWKGVKGWPAGAPSPKFKPGQKVTVHVPPEPGIETDAEVEGKASIVSQLVLSERVTVQPDGSMKPTGQPMVWAYVLELQVQGQPVRVDEGSLKAT